MKLVILGSGTSVPHAQRASAAHWLETDSGTLLLDCSPDAAHRMAEEQLDWPNLDVIWISHFHLDHLGGLATFLFGTRWAPQTQHRQKPLVIYGGAGLRTLLRTFDEANDYKLFKQSFAVEVREVAAGEEFDVLPGLRMFTTSTPHTRESMAIRVTDTNDASFVYTSDTGYADEIADFARGADLLLMECSFWRNKPMNTHLELADAMKIAHLAGPRKVVLTHLYPEWDGVDLVAEAGRLWDGEVIAASDGLRLEVGV